MKRQTQAIHTAFARRDAYDAISMPVYHSVAYEFDDAATMADAFTNRIDAPDYSRVENPTVTHLEQKVKALTQATAVTAFNNGMAAISATLITLAEAGQTIVTSRHLFGNTFSLIVSTLARLGIRHRLVDMTNAEEVEAAMDESVCAIFLEVLTNPQLEVADLKALSAVAHKWNVPLVADSTAIPFTEHHLHDLGVDIEVVSSTKYISGGATSLGGLVIDYGTRTGFNERLKLEVLFNLGGYMTPHAAYMQTIGLETLHARYGVQSANAKALATRLKAVCSGSDAPSDCPLRAVNYVGLADNPYHALAATQFGPTAGAMLTIDLASEEACFDFLNKLKLIRRATNLFDNRTLAIHPASTIFGLFTPEELQAMDVHDTTIRLSIGLEDADDLFEDICQALGLSQLDK
ncbi:MAG: PLP-dependent transferase [Bacteroidaceae bacterium]|nr:PLP-dependent transferase [Bacteroidaceae bacterium]